MAVNEVPNLRAAGRKVFMAAAVLFPLIAVIGFARTYYLRGVFGGPPVPSTLVHVHSIVMTLWLALFSAQIWLISSKRVKLHQRLGYAGVALAVVLCVVGLMTAVAAGKDGSTSFPAEIPRLAFMVVPFFDIVVFAILFAGAIYYRRRPANHKRLILLTAISFMPPALARIPLDFMAAAGPLAFFGIPSLIAIACVIVDSWKCGKLNKVFLAGTLLMIVSYPLRLLLGFTETWKHFAGWLTTLI